MGALQIQGEQVSFRATDGLRLDGFLAGRRKAGLCIIYVHGMASNFYSGGIPLALMRAARRAGYSVLAANTRGHDIESSGTVALGGKRRRIRTGTRYERFEESVRDIDGALRFLKSIGYSRFVLAGHSTGCQKILYYQYRRRNRKVRAMVLLAPDDDYNLNKKELGRKWARLVKKARRMVRLGRGNACCPALPFSPQRFLSVADPGRIEARLFNYDGKLREFSSIRIPMYVIFGSRDEGAVKPVEMYMKILREKANSTAFDSMLIRGASHSFTGYEDAMAASVVKWIADLPKA